MEKLASRVRGCVQVHIPLGIFNALLLAMDPAAGITFGLGFLGYEHLQDKYKKDESYKDIFGWLCGIAIGVVVLWVLKYLPKGAV